ncbi:hypothetical protein B0H17DRAFT_1216337 [Mycena rosella]|uniref:NACHT domain-containing protein n=1 Tax=Mycena rosella TaxID=1033263 RepID=A0AAD7C9J5_MYCRO|nr:hypothetical protein B0H17DRAFT_1216337 [Mycena rosella]
MTESDPTRSQLANSEGPHSTFQRALDAYIASLPEKKKKRKFIVACCATGAPITPESINDSIKRAEQKNGEQPGKRMMKKVLSPVVDVLRDYNDIISNLASADPMPTAIIWGALKVVVDGAHRFFNLFDTIKKELRLLTTQLQRITDYEYLYGDSEMLQKMLCNSYINMLRFWSRTLIWITGFTGLLKAATSFSTNKLNQIIKDIEEDADQIEKLASILEATKGKDERQAAELERFKAGLERTAAQKERSAQAAWREENQGDRQGERYRHICSQLETHKGQHLNGTCDWLLQHRTYVDWRDGHSSPSILWVHAPPAAGKSILSSRVIHVIKEEPDAAAAVAYHFYRFDQMNSSSETLRFLASQLFDAHWNRAHLVSEEMYLQTQQSVCSLENAEELITMLVKLLPRSYFILDGLDEECMGSKRWTEAVTTLDFLISLAKDFPDRVRLWYSSQHRPCINEKLKEYVVLDIKDKVKDDVSLYLSRANPELGDLEVSDRDKDNVLKSLQARAEGNFLWASLMLKSLKETASLTDMKQFVKDGLPETLDDYYRRIFDRFEKPHRSLVSKIFALVVFARRPLRMLEVREAVGLLLSKNPRSLNAADMPFISRLRTLLPPLIEVQQDGCADPDDCTCRLFHSTVRNFLFKNPGVLQTASDPTTDLLINQDVIANACLLYLCQTRYSRPLRKRDARWVDASGESVDRHQFHLYSAKYWDKHLDEITQPSEELNNRVGSFIASANFQTCVQVQSLWVDSQFGVFCYPDDDRVYLRRMFPSWFVYTTPAGFKLWRDFREFVHSWKYFLHCPFDDPTSVTLPYTGELDRCWWPALDPRNFLSKLKCKYTTFRFQSGDLNATGGHFFEGVGEDGTELVTLVLASRTNGSLKTQTIVTDEKATNWRLYVKHSKDENSNMRAGRAQPVAFAQSNDFLRIGTQLFARDKEGSYIAVPGFSAAYSYHPAYVEEFAVRGDITVVASRRRVIAAEKYGSGLPDEKVNSFGSDFLKMEGTRRAWIDSEADDSDGESSSSDSSSESEDAGYETWSDCSTEYSEGLEDDIITPWAGPMSDMGDDQTDSAGDSSSSDESDEDAGQKSESETTAQESDSDGSDVDPSAVVGYGLWHDDDKDGVWSESDTDDSASETSITIFDKSSNDVPMTLFHFTKPLPFLLYDSPPAIHPSKSLVVWSLSAGDVLFADFLAKTYFVRKLRPSTLHTRHIFMKCHFSQCGVYVHFASLEGQKKPGSRRKKNDAEQPPVKLALLVSTYRLSIRKTTRSPPSLVHRVRLYLGSKTTLAVSKLPYTLTWTPTDLYFTCSDKVLKVFRISLFDTAKASSSVQQEHPILVPRKPIFLPESAEKRQVYYFPPAGESTTATVIVGNEMRGRTAELTGVKQLRGGGKDALLLYTIHNVFGRLAPPVGCYLQEDADLGGWSKSHDRSTLPDDLGIGQLDHRLEKFDPHDDCQLEPYVL